MKRLVIKPPPAGRTTVSLVTHRYLDRAEATAKGCDRGTQTIYLGSFPIDLEPRRLDGVDRIQPGDTSSGVSVRPNISLDGTPLELQHEDVQQIRSWLLTHGSWAKGQADLARWREKQEQVQAEERARLESQLRSELHEKIRAEVLEEVKRDLEAHRGHPVEEAVRAVRAAGRAVQEEATRLKAGGHRMVTRRGKLAGTDEAPVYQLLDLTLALRKQAFAEFEDECKAVGLMSHKPAPRRPKGSGRQ